MKNMDTPLVEAVGKLGKPFLHISAHIDHEGYGMDDDMSWRKKELKRLREGVKATEEQIKNWNAEEVAAKALKSIKSDLAMKKARIMETEAMIGISEEKDEAKKGKEEKA